MTTPDARPSGDHAATPFAALGGAMISITLGATMAESLFGVIGPVGTTALRLSIAAVVLALAFRIWRAPIAFAQLRPVVPYGVALGLMNTLYYLAIDRIPIGIAIAFEFVGPLTVAVLSSRRASHFAWIALAVLGLALLLLVGRTHRPLDPAGVALALGAGAFWGLYIVSGRRAGHAVGARAPAFGMIIGALVVLPFGIALHGRNLLGGQVLERALVVALLSSAIPYSLEMFALRRLPTRIFGVMMSAEPAVGAVMGALLLHQSLPPVAWLGMAAVIGASAGMTLTSGDNAAATGERVLAEPVT